MKLLSIGRIARICKVHPNRVAEWFNSGLVELYEHYLPKQFVFPENLKNFFKENGMASELSDLEEEYAEKILIISDDKELITSVNDLIVKFSTKNRGIPPRLYVLDSTSVADAWNRDYAPRLVIMDLCCEAVLWYHSVRNNRYTKVINLYPANWSLSQYSGKSHSGFMVPKEDENISIILMQAFGV